VFSSHSCPVKFSERFAATECKLAVQGTEQETLFSIRKGIPDVKLFFVMDPEPVPVPEETQVTHLALKPPYSKSSLPKATDQQVEIIRHGTILDEDVA
jgi:hypothetical protein